MQNRLALFVRDCELRVCVPTHSRDCHLLKVQRLRTSQLRGAHHGAPVPAGTRTSEKILLAASTKPATIEAHGVPFHLTPGVSLCSLSESTSLTYPRNFLNRSDWFSHRGIAGFEGNILSIQEIANN